MSVNEQALEEAYQTFLKGNALAKHVNEEPLTLPEFAALLRIRGYSNCTAVDFINWLVKNEYIAVSGTGEQHIKHDYFAWAKADKYDRHIVLTVEGQDFFLDKFASGEFKICCCGVSDCGD